MINKILEYIDEYDMLLSTGTVLVCVSGGADSMCLLEVMRHISYERGLTIAVAHYNHMLRGDESDRDETFVLNICEEHNFMFFSGRGDVSTYAKKHGKGIEEAARDMRYSYFIDTAIKIGAERIATAHTMNDNTETMLLNLVRGTGTNGMSGIPPKRDMIIRPLLCITRTEVMEFLTDRKIDYVEDSTNNLDIYTRNKLRNNVIPLLEEINPKLNEAAFSAAGMFRADEEFVADIADLFINDCCAGATADAADLAVLPFSVSSRVIRRLCNTTLSYRNVKDVLALCLSDNPSASISLPGMVAYRQYDRIIFDDEPIKGEVEFAPVYPSIGNIFVLLGLGLKITCKSSIYNDNISTQKVHTSFTSFEFKSVDICGKITVRARREGDSIKLLGQSGTKKIKKLFIDKKIPVRQRALIPIICDDEGVLGIYKIGVANRAVPKNGDTVTQIIFEEM
ncbi:MAG: tRNA lysidine(34) synthetase TilS [Oscillospiraceae bacterium]|nr:tRNA lysidine(34) synthetase TilS [Oscillospiraceae bacterium]